MGGEIQKKKEVLLTSKPTTPRLNNRYHLNSTAVSIHYNSSQFHLPLLLALLLVLVVLLLRPFLLPNHLHPPQQLLQPSRNPYELLHPLPNLIPIPITTITTKTALSPHNGQFLPHPLLKLWIEGKVQ